MLEFSAAAKLAELEVLGGSGALDWPRSFLVLVMGTEWVIGIWLLSGLRPMHARFAVLALFATFAAVSGMNVVSGTKSCGCFGELWVTPSWMLSGDVLAVAALCLCSPKALHASGTLPPYVRAMTVGAIGLVWILGGAALLARISGASGAADKVVLRDGSVLLQPRNWSGKPFPLLADITVGGEVAKGGAIVLLFRPDCDHCRRALPRYQRVSEHRVEHRGKPVAVFLIEMPPYSRTDDKLSARSGSVEMGRLSNARQWVVATPVAVLLLDGTVVKATEGSEAEWPESLLGDGPVSRDGA